MIDFTPLVRPYFARRVKASLSWRGQIRDVQLTQLQWLLRALRATRWGVEHGLAEAYGYDDYRRLIPVPVAYSELRPYVMRMIDGESDVLWPGVTRNFAQSSGTSDG